LDMQKRPLGTTGLHCSPLGFGGYRIGRSDPAHKAALCHYLESGGNLIDTSSNYGLGDSELLVGEALHDLGRDGVIVVTKGGYIQGQNKMTATQLGYPEVVKFAPDVWHCMHPKFLADQIDLSLARLNLKTIDVYLLHNPEYFLKDAANRGEDTEGAREEFYRRIREAFGFLETRVQSGQIAWYGISSNSFGYDESEPNFNSVARCLEVATSIMPDHHFRVIQLPLNLYESGGALKENNDGQSVLEFCNRQGIGVLINRPLNALVDGRLVRLADVATDNQPSGEATVALQRLGEHESAFSSQFDYPLMSGGMGAAGWLAPVVEQLPSLEEFRRLVTQSFTPAANTWLHNVDQTLKSVAGYGEWRQELGRRLDDVLSALQSELAKTLATRAHEVRSQLKDVGVVNADASLSQLTIATLLNLTGTSCVLNGMRRVDYVDDALGAAQLHVSNAMAVLDSLAGSKSD
jgi:aryl-alcohol dehydrogenase-like predicted oxidoreductase